MSNNEDRFDDKGKIHDRERLKELQSLSLSKNWYYICKNN